MDPESSLSTDFKDNFILHNISRRAIKQDFPIKTNPFFKMASLAQSVIPSHFEIKLFLSTPKHPTNNFDIGIVLCEALYPFILLRGKYAVF